MATNPKHIGKKYGPFTYAVGLEKMREFAYAISGGVPLATISPPCTPAPGPTSTT